MREILFRGKRVDNGEWVEGAFLNDRDGTFYICPVVSDITYGDNGNRRRIGCWYKIDPETLCEYTGLPDKNGKRIFEGDVLRIGGKSLPHWLDEGDIKTVEYNEGAFSPLCDYDSDCGMFVESSECEVIGNIHDNPELLEVSGDE